VRLFQLGLLFFAQPYSAHPPSSATEHFTLWHFQQALPKPISQLLNMYVCGLVTYVNVASAARELPWCCSKTAGSNLLARLKACLHAYQCSSPELSCLQQKHNDSYLLAPWQTVTVFQQPQCKSHVPLSSFAAQEFGLMGASVPARTDQPLQFSVRVCTAREAS